MNRLAGFLVVASVAGAAWAPAPARACSVAGPQPHVVDPALQATDQTPPALPPLPAPQITRGKAPKQSGCTSSASSCDDLGSVGLFPQATDDFTPPAKIGYRLTLESGSLPTGLTLPGPGEPLDGELTLAWIDGATDDQEPIDFTLRVVAIDLAGNESTPQSVRVLDDPGFGCAVARPRGPNRGLTFVAFATLLLAVLRPRRKTLRGSSGSRGASASDSWRVLRSCSLSTSPGRFSEPKTAADVH